MKKDTPIPEKFTRLKGKFSTPTASQQQTNKANIHSTVEQTQYPTKNGLADTLNSMTHHK